MIKKIAYKFLRFADRALQIVVPARSDYVCYLSKPDYNDNAFYLYKYVVQNRRNLKHVWLVRDSDLRERLNMDFNEWNPASSGNKLEVVNKLSIKGYYLFLRSRYIFHTHGAYAFSNWSARRHVVNLWHGMPIKCIGTLNSVAPNPNLTFGTLHIATSKFFQYAIACAFNVPHDRVLVSGLPRCAILADKGAFAGASTRLREKLGIAEGRKVILWMPTYRTEVAKKDIAKKTIRTFLDDISDELMEQISRNAIEQDIEVVIKLHPADPLNHLPRSLDYAGISMLRMSDWQSIDMPLYELIAGSDALVSDVSSVLIDYLLTERPLAVLGFDSKTYTRDLVFSDHYFLKSKRILHISTASDVRKFFGLVSSRAINAACSDDISSVFHDDLRSNSAETILGAVGLTHG